MKTKKMLIILFGFLFIIAQNCENEDPRINKDIIGTWFIVQVDSCRNVVYPGADTTTLPIIYNEGNFEFRKNGSGIANSSKDFFCGADEFRWHYYLDTIELKADNFVSESSVTNLGKDTIFFSIISCENKIGVNIWFEITLKKEK